ncbi:MAG TPA: HD domain-containing phosphohydrolase [Mycobacteriales bacterium]
MGERWVTRPWLGLGVRVAVLAVPLAASFAAVEIVPRTLPAALPRWAAVLATASAALLVGLVAERTARRMLPLSGLLRMTMLFPDRAPSRLRVLRASASTRELRNRLAADDSDAADAAAATLALITALGAHDRRTRGHSERVRVFADLLGGELGLPEPDLDRLRWAALLHDIGKLEIAAQVLNKPGRLDADEWDRVRSHPLDGAALAAPLMDWLGGWGRGIPEHHERYDGRGYPLGLAADGISRAGRVIAVIDAFETMTAARSYKSPMTTRAARAELARCAGDHFDPQVVRAFLGISLPRLLWAMGPVAFLVHLPFLRSLESAGAHVGSAVASASGATVIAVGAAVVPHPVPVEVPRPVVQRLEMPAAAHTAVAGARAPRLPGNTVTAASPGRSPSPSPTPTPPARTPVPTPVPVPVPVVTGPPRVRSVLPRPRDLPRPKDLPRPRDLPLPTVPLHLPPGLHLPELPLPGDLHGQGDRA